jgi:hypothetical protein
MFGVDGWMGCLFFCFLFFVFCFFVFSFFSFSLFPFLKRDIVNHEPSYVWNSPALDVCASIAAAACFHLWCYSSDWRQKRIAEISGMYYYYYYLLFIIIIIIIYYYYYLLLLIKD